LLHKDLDDWRITFVDTGSGSTVGERLRLVRPYLGGDAVFMANYADALTNLDLDAYLEYFNARDRVASFVSVAAPHTFHIVESDPDDSVRKLEAVTSSPVRINGGFFVFSQRIFDYLRPGEELVVEPFERLIAQRQLLAYPFDGFWLNMDTFKDKQRLDDLLSKDDAPWQVWRRGASRAAAVHRLRQAAGA
jgi:glucose-1-phosphate cytidylyltransferase